LEEFWQAGVSNNQRCTLYVENYLLKELGRPLVLAIDDADYILRAEFQTDFLGMLRSWHENRVMPTTPIWKQLDLVLVMATEPHHRIEHLYQSPFNVGEVILLNDFTPKQVMELNQRYGSPLAAGQVEQLYGLLHGHPYLVQLALYLLVRQEFDFEELLAESTQYQGPFASHWSYLHPLVFQNEDLIQGLVQMIRNHTCSDERISSLLAAVGLIRQEGRRQVFRCQLYENYFREQLHG
jgi:hypothetical protein